MNSFGVMLGIPRDGWIEVRASSGDQLFLERVSYTPNDFVAELAAAVLALARGDVPEAVVANGEPHTFEFRFSGAADTAESRLHIVRFADHRRERGAPQHIVFTAELARAQLCHRFWLAFRRLETSISPELYEESMRRSFPTATLARLRQVVSRPQTNSHRPGDVNRGGV